MSGYRRLEAGYPHKIGAHNKTLLNTQAKTPLRTSSTVTYVVAGQSLKRGDIITASDLELVTGTLSGFSDYFNSVDGLIGRRLKRHLSIGKMVRATFRERTGWFAKANQLPWKVKSDRCR